MNWLGVPQTGQFFSAADVPQSQLPIGGAAEEARAVRRKRQRFHRSRARCQSPNLLASHDDALFKILCPATKLVVSTTPLVTKSVRTPTTAPLSRLLRWKLSLSGGSGAWSVTFRVRVVPGRSAFFVPPDISGCSLWLRADLGITLNGSNASAWADQSGNGNNASQNTTGAQPPYVAGAMNGFPALQGDGSARYMTTSAFTLGASASFIAAVQPAIATQVAFTRLLETQSNTGYLLGCSSTGATYKWIVNSPSSPYGTAEGGSIATTRQLVAGIYDSGSGVGALYLNAGAIATSSFTAPSSQSLPLFIMKDFWGGAQFWNGYLAEAIVYNRALTTTELRRLHGYLGARYNVTLSP